MAQFVVEIYRARNDDAYEHVQRARAAAEELSRAGTPARHLRSIFLPDDETCLYFYQADSADVVRRVAQNAELPFARIVEAVTDPT